MSSKKAVFRFVLASGLAIAGLAVLFGLLGGTQEQVHAAAPRFVTNSVGGGSASFASPRLEPPLNSVQSPIGARPAAPLSILLFRPRRQPHRCFHRP